MKKVATAAKSANSCLVYNYYGGANPTSCTVPAPGTGNNGNAMGYFFQDTTYPSLGHTATHTYDSLNRLLTSVATGSSTYNLTFSYDRYGNMTCTGGTGLCTSMTYDTTNNNNRLLKIGSASVTYDAAGNVTGDGTYTYQWDAEGRLASVGGFATASFTYNALGQAAEKNISNGADYREMYYDPSGRMSLVGNNVTNLEDYFPAVGGRNYGKYESSKTYFMHSNPLGSTGMLTDQTAGPPLEDELYYPWGQRWTLIELSAITGQGRALPRIS